MADQNPWAVVPFHFWSAVYFVFGSIVGSFLNVCIHRMPRGESVVSPPSHCPHCGYSIPWFLNIPLVTWCWLRGKCANCRAPISPRYLCVELLTGLAFLGTWLAHGRADDGATLLLAVAYSILLAGLIAATFIDFEHFIIPDEITLGGIVVGFLVSAALPALHDAPTRAKALEQSALGIAVGAGLVYAILRVGKLLFGRYRVKLPENSKITFTETALHLPEETVPFEEIFYRNSDTIQFHAARLEMVDRCCWDVKVRLSPKKLRVGDDVFDPETVHHLEAETGEVVLPREAMGLGDVKFMAAIGAFLGWKAVVFSLMASSVIGSAVGIGLVVFRRREWSSRIPYGPYIALAAALWVYGHRSFMRWWWPR
ncbi:MAG: prepilin peptidase [Verrucomicrobia bacterium]|nr:prepilin peptidase [Verrucomicrobiota bacterium]